MTRPIRQTRSATKNEEGASAVEYGLLVAAIAAVIILVVFALGSFVKGSFKDTCDAFDDASNISRAGSAANTTDCDD
jgi:pilus assembly protein Flp/PilA